MIYPSSNYFFLTTFFESDNLCPHQTEAQPRENRRSFGDTYFIWFIVLIVEPEPQGFVLVSIYDPWTILGVHHL